MIHLAMPICDYFGAGTLGTYLYRELVKRTAVTLYDRMNDEEPTCDLYDPLIQLTGPELNQQTKFRGRPNVGYIFSEWSPVTEAQKENLKAFDILLAGSEWNAQVIRDAGFKCVAVQQGVDRDVFKPLPRLYGHNFVIYSGGKYEDRKAQDLVIRAVRILQERHPDILLMASWINVWGLNSNPYDHPDIKLIGLPILDQPVLAAYMAQTDVGLFPNRCEGGTNLVMMDYLACGKPVIANVSTGQKDVLHRSYSVFMEGRDRDLVDDMVRGVEMMYFDRQRMRRMSERADKAMDAWSWALTAEKIERAINDPVE